MMGILSKVFNNTWLMIMFLSIIFIALFFYITDLQNKYGCNRECEVEEYNQLCFYKSMNSKERNICLEDNKDIVEQICKGRCLNNLLLGGW